MSTSIMITDLGGVPTPLSSRQLCSDLPHSLCGKPPLTASNVTSSLSPCIILLVQARYSSPLLASPSDAVSHPAREQRGLRYTDHPSVPRGRLYLLTSPRHHGGKLWQNTDDLQTRGPLPAKWKHPKYLFFQGDVQKTYSFFFLALALPWLDS